MAQDNLLSAAHLLRELGPDLFEAITSSDNTGAVREFAQTLVKPKQPELPSLVGRIYKTIVVPAYQASSFAEAVRLGNFDNAAALGATTRLWGKEPVGLDKPVKIDLVEFNRHWWHNEVVAWGEQNKKTPMQTTHTMGIAAGNPDEQRERPIIQVSSAQDGSLLCLGGGSDWRYLNRGAVGGRWNRDFVVGFLSE